MQDPISKITTAKRTEAVAQVVEHLPSKCKAKIQTPVLPKTKQKPLYTSFYAFSPVTKVLMLKKINHNLWKVFKMRV
jgi:hypothetical protein